MNSYRRIKKYKVLKCIDTVLSNWAFVIFFANSSKFGRQFLCAQNWLLISKTVCGTPSIKVWKMKIVWDHCKSKLLLYLWTAGLSRVGPINLCLLYFNFKRSFICSKYLWHDLKRFSQIQKILIISLKSFCYQYMAEIMSYNHA